MSSTESSLALSTTTAAAGRHLYGMGVTALGVFILSFEAVLVRLAATSGWNVAFWRGVFITLALALLLLWREGGAGFRVFRRGLAPWLCAFLFGTSGFFFVLSLTLTKAANTVVLASSAPIFAALLSWLWLRERVPLRTWIAIAVAFAGVVLVFAGSMSGDGWLGNLCALVPALSLGGTFTVLRRHPDLPRMPLVWGGGVVTALFALPLAEPLTLSWSGYAAVALQGGLVLPASMVLMAVGTRYLSAPEVSLFLLIEATLGPVWVWLAVGEQPPALTFVGGAMILVTLAVHAWLGAVRTQSTLQPR
ncbi:MAG TPA: DMT family transporter [Candidatus Competibacteraceae bacterium]|nr:DMT family transporter [Candidatus Competibacteraceae bacterium]